MRLVRRVGRRLESEVFVRTLARRNVSTGSGTRFVGRPIIDVRPGAQIIIGDRVRIVSDPRMATLGTEHAAIFRALLPGAIITLGDDVGITGGAICAVSRITIGQGTMLGADVIVADTDFHPLHSENRRYASLPDPSPGDEVLIGENVFIGTRSVVLKGSTIGRNSVIGAGSVVSGEIPPNTIAAGVPARKIGMVKPIPNLHK